MFDIRPPLRIVAQVLVVTGAAMLLPAAVDAVAGNDNWRAFVTASVLTMLVGAITALSCQSAQRKPGLSLRQAFLMTASGWILVAGFATLPLIWGAPGLNFTDAYFETVSGITTTGATVIVGLEHLPPGANLWRGLLNWMGGLGFSFLALVFLPYLRVGGMQFFQTSGFDTMGKVLPRAHEIAGSLMRFYIGLTLVIYVTYHGFGMSSLEAAVHAFSTVSTGGLSTQDRSFAAYQGNAEYAAALFMILAGMPFIRFVQLLQGTPKPMLQDWQVRTYLCIIVIVVALTTAWRLATQGGNFEPVLRSSLFNMVSILTGTGYSSGDVASWGGFVMALAFIAGMIGGCTSSTSASISVFRWQIAVLAIRRQIQQLYSPSRVVKLRYQGREVGPEVLDPTIAFFTAFVLLFGLMSALLAISGVDMISAIFAVWMALGNIGFGFGEIVSRTGTMVDIPTFDKWVLIAAMLLGRVGIMPMIVLLLPRFWRG